MLIWSRNAEEALHCLETRDVDILISSYDRQEPLLKECDHKFCKKMDFLQAILTLSFVCKKLVLSPGYFTGDGRSALNFE